LAVEESKEYLVRRGVLCCGLLVGKHSEAGWTVGKTRVIGREHHLVRTWSNQPFVSSLIFSQPILWGSVNFDIDGSVTRRANWIAAGQKSIEKENAGIGHGIIQGTHHIGSPTRRQLKLREFATATATYGHYIATCRYILHRATSVLGICTQTRAG
jgi:hypothetical protein